MPPPICRASVSATTAGSTRRRPRGSPRPWASRAASPVATITAGGRHQRRSSSQIQPRKNNSSPSGMMTTRLRSTRISPPPPPPAAVERGAEREPPQKAERARGHRLGHHRDGECQAGQGDDRQRPPDAQRPQTAHHAPLAGDAGKQDAEEAEHNAVNGHHEDADPHEQGLSRERIDGQRPLPAGRPHHADPNGDAAEGDNEGRDRSEGEDQQRPEGTAPQKRRARRRRGGGVEGHVRSPAGNGGDRPRRAKGRHRPGNADAAG